MKNMDMQSGCHAEFIEARLTGRAGIMRWLPRSILR
jgi:hypothetical protein